MEIKCKVCGTINDGETNFCKGCFVKLDIEDPNIVSYNPKENEKSASIIEETESVIPWENSEETLNQQEEVKTEELFEFKPIEDGYVPSSLSEEKNDISIVNEMVEFKPIKDAEDINESTEIKDFNNNEMPSLDEIIFDDSKIQETKEIITSNKENEQIEFKPMDDNIEEIGLDESTEVKVFDDNEMPSLDTIVTNNNEIQEIEEIVVSEETNEIVEPIEDNNEEVKLNESDEIDEIISDNEIESTEEIIESVEPQIETDNEVEEENSIPETWQMEEVKEELPELDMSEFEDDDNWDEEIEEEKSENINYLNPSKLFFRFLLNCSIIGIIFGALCIGFRYILTSMFEIGNKAELIFIVISSVTSIATLLIATDRTFKKGLPIVSKINKTTLLILFFIALPYLLIKLAYNLYIGTTFVIFLILVALTLVILAIFFNYMRTLIRNKQGITDDDKGIIIYGIFSIILVGLTLYGVYIYKNKDYDISFDILLHDSKNVEMVQTYINEVEKALLKNKTEIDGYQIPEKIENVEFASIDGNKPDGMVLYINDNGKVTSGTVVIGTNVYSYDGEKVKAN